MQKLTFFVLFCFHTILFGQDYFPKNDGVKQSFKNYTVFTNALIHVNATTKIEDGTLVIKEGKIVGMFKDAAYQSNTQEFWNACVKRCGKNDYRLGGTFSDGKGQPSQVSAVSHGSATTRFNGVKVINTGSRI